MKKSIAEENGSLRQDATAKLLLLTSRSELSAPQLQEAAALTSQISDWPKFIDIATRKFSITYAHKALSQIASAAIPDEYRKKLRDSARLMGLRALKVAAAQVAFHKTCIQPITREYAYVKGPALSIQHGRNFAERNCRDIDVLVSRTDIEKVALTAWKNGYDVALTVNPTKLASSARDIKFLTRFTNEIKLFNKDGFVFELHTRLDKHSKVFDTDEAIETADTIELSGVEMKTLSQPLHFVYICYHHARHLWSHLHWLADLDLMISKGCERTEALAYASSKGIQPTVDAAYNFHNLISRPGQWSMGLEERGLEHDFLKGCLANLDGGLELEYALKEGRYLHDFNIKSQVSEARIDAFSKSPWTDDFRPSLTQFLKRPYPSYLFWLYRVERAIIGVRDAIKRALGISIEGSEPDNSSKDGNPEFERSK